MALFVCVCFYIVIIWQTIISVYLTVKPPYLSISYALLFYFKKFKGVILPKEHRHLFKMYDSLFDIYCYTLWHHQRKLEYKLRLHIVSHYLTSPKSLPYHKRGSAERHIDSFIYHSLALLMGWVQVAGFMTPGSLLSKTEGYHKYKKK